MGFVPDPTLCRCIFPTRTLLMPGVVAKSGKKTPHVQLPVQLELGAGKPDREVSFSRPFLKWAGGKTQLLPQLVRFYPPKGSIKRYLEPFLGSGAVVFHFSAMVEPRNAVLWD